MTPLLIIWILTAVLGAAGTAAIVLLVRSGGRSWHPGDPLPHIPADAPLHTWHASAQRTRATGTRPAPERRTPEPRSRVAETAR